MECIWLTTFLDTDSYPLPKVYVLQIDIFKWSISYEFHMHHSELGWIISFLSMI